MDLLGRHLLETHARGRRVVLIVDEAQNLSAHTLEQVRLLTNLETATTKLLQIILIGQPELRDLLERPELRQLAQRITGALSPEPAVRGGNGRLRQAPHARRGRDGRGVHARRAARDPPAERRHAAHHQRDLRPCAARRVHARGTPRERRARARGGRARSTAGRCRRHGCAGPSLARSRRARAGRRRCSGRCFEPGATRRRPLRPRSPSHLPRRRARSRGPTRPRRRRRPAPPASTSCSPGTATTRPPKRRSASSSPPGAPTYDPSGGKGCDQAARQGLECLFQKGSWAQLRTLNRPAILTLTDDIGRTHQVAADGARRRDGDDRSRRRSTRRCRSPACPATGSAISCCCGGRRWRSRRRWRPACAAPTCAGCARACGSHRVCRPRRPATTSTTTTSRGWCRNSSASTDSTSTAWRACRRRSCSTPW